MGALNAVAAWSLQAREASLLMDASTRMKYPDEAHP
jgi:hypothetical protein